MAQDILITPGSGEPQILFRGSGTYDTPIELNVLSSYQSASSSGSALLFEGTEGQLFAITDNLSSGVIFSVAGAAGLPFIEADASGDVRLIEYGRYVGVGTGTPAYQLDVFGTGRFSEGILFADGNIQTGAYTGDAGGGGGTTYTAGSGLVLDGTEFNVHGGTGNFKAIEFTDKAGAITIGSVGGASSTYASTSSISIGKGAGATGVKPPSAAATSDIAIGITAGAESSGNIGCINIGNLAGGSSTSNQNSICIGGGAGSERVSCSSDICIGPQAGYGTSGAGNLSIGAVFAGTQMKGTYNVAIGSLTLNNAVGNFNMEITPVAAGYIAGSVSNKMNLGNVILGDTSSKLLALGNVSASDLTPDATLEIKPASSTNIPLIVHGAAAQSENLQEWQDSAGVTLASVDHTGNISGSNNLTIDGVLDLTTNHLTHFIGIGASLKGSSAQYIRWNTGGSVDIHNTYYNNGNANLNQGRGTSFFSASTMSHHFMGNGGIRILDIGNEHYQMDLGLQFTSSGVGALSYTPDAIIRTSGTSTLFMYAEDGVKIMNLGELGVRNSGYTGIGTEYRDLTARTGIFTSGVRFGDGTTQTTAAAGATPGGSDTNIQFNNGGSFSGESTLTWNYDTDALTVSGNTLMAGTGVILDVKTTGGTTLFAVEDTTETTLVVNSQDGQTSHPFEVRDAFGITAASIDVSGNISGNHLSFGDGTTQTTAATASGPPAVVSDTGTAITMVCNTHADKYLRTTANSAVTITFPSGLGCDANSEFTFEQAGSGQITVTGAAGVTINTSSTTKTYTQFSVISMKQVATDTYTLFGDTASF